MAPWLYRFCAGEGYTFSPAFDESTSRHYGLNFVKNSFKLKWWNIMEVPDGQQAPAFFLHVTRPDDTFDIELNWRNEDSFKEIQQELVYILTVFKAMGCANDLTTTLVDNGTNTMLVESTNHVGYAERERGPKVILKMSISMGSEYADKPNVTVTVHDLVEPGEETEVVDEDAEGPESGKTIVLDDDAGPDSGSKKRNSTGKMEQDAPTKRTKGRAYAHV